MIAACPTREHPLRRFVPGRPTPFSMETRAARAALARRELREASRVPASVATLIFGRSVMAHDGIAAVVDLAIGTARRRASKTDIALGLIAALRRIRGVLDDEGPARAGQFDATVRDVV